MIEDVGNLLQGFVGMVGGLQRRDQSLPGVHALGMRRQYLAINLVGLVRVIALEINRRQLHLQLQTRLPARGDLQFRRTLEEVLRNVELVRLLID